MLQMVIKLGFHCVQNTASMAEHAVSLIRKRSWTKTYFRLSWVKSLIYISYNNDALSEKNRLSGNQKIKNNIISRYLVT